MIYDSIMAFDVVKPSTHLIELMEKHSEIRNYRAGETFIQSGDSLERVIFVAQGRVSCFSLSANGLERIIYILNPGHFIGEGSFTKSRSTTRATRSAKALTDVKLFWIRRQGYETLMQHRDFVDLLLASSSRKNAFFRHELENTAFFTLSYRLKQLLIASVDHSNIDGQWIGTTMEFSQSDIAAILGVNRVTINKELKKLCDENFIRYVNRRIQVNQQSVLLYQQDCYMP